MLSIEIPIVDDDNFDTTLEFSIVLEDPVNCELGRYLKVCRVLILDNDQFPSNDFEDEIADGSDEALQEVGVKLMIAYMKFTFIRVPTVMWKSILIASMDQLHNAYYMMTIFLRVYLVDVVLNFKHEETLDRLLVPNNRKLTAICLGLAWILPNFLLLALEVLKVGPLDLGTRIRLHLRVNLFRKYLNYSEDSRAAAPIQDLTKAMAVDIPSLVERSFLSAFELLRGLGKICCVAIFIMNQDKKNAIPLLIYPIAMLAFISCRQRQQLKLMSDESAGDSEAQGMLVRAVTGFGLITDYKQRSFVVERYEQLLSKQGGPEMKLIKFNFWNEQLVPWLTLIAIGGYIALGSQEVLSGDVSLGQFLATINVYKDLGDRFEGVYTILRSGLQVIEPLIGLVKMLNAKTDLPERMARNRVRRGFVKEKLKREMTARASQKMGNAIFDSLPICLDNICIDRVSNLRNICADVPQGSIVLITGPHGCGKATLVSLLTDNRNPDKGNVLCPSYLRALHVSYVPEMITYLTLYENLTFGSMDANPTRVRNIYMRMGLKNPRLLRTLDEDVAAGVTDPEKMFDKPMRASRTSRASSAGRASSGSRGTVSDEEAIDADDSPWYTQLSTNEKKLLHLTRALVYNPEILVLHRPVDEVDNYLTKDILNVLQEFVDNYLTKDILNVLQEFVEKKGLELDPKDFKNRRPRSVFFTGGEVKESQTSAIADVVWRLSTQKGKGLVEERHMRH
eukprot:gnl/TRDRNA2_/TRDRNA2_158171_c4_seq1.p1 gnl/TRDRNA2_/TRDRNA2_158171_c4~~gnl/TRDRNA2_/TRDRNA2_158171_c4_seq1.p1  ORF type:complete len:859 (+),score=147.28 gnl/TRDRNA2_/TRDRNA2_158171_c4_seq1:373-2577(+)